MFQIGIINLPACQFYFEKYLNKLFQESIFVKLNVDWLWITFKFLFYIIVCIKLTCIDFKHKFSKINFFFGILGKKLFVLLILHVNYKRKKTKTKNKTRKKQQKNKQKKRQNKNKKQKKTKQKKDKK